MKKIYFTGAHSTGKTTLAKAVAEATGLPLLKETARVVLQEMGLTYPVPPDRLDEVQTLIAKKQLKLFANCKDSGFVSDRFLDFLAYWSVRGTVPNYFASDYFKRKLVECKVRIGYVFALPVRRDLLVTDGVRTTADWEECVRIDAANKAVMAIFGIKWHEVRALSVEDRVKEVLEVVGW